MTFASECANTPAFGSVLSFGSLTAATSPFAKTPSWSVCRVRDVGVDEARDAEEL
jgi:hypothetical protein